MGTLPTEAASPWITFWFIASGVALALAFLVSTRKETILGPDEHRVINYATLMELLAISLILLAIGVEGRPLTIETPFKVTHAALDAIGGGNIVPDYLGRWYQLYGLVLSLTGRLATIGLVISLFRKSLAVPRLYLRSLHRDTYVFSHLNEDTLALAKDVARAYSDPACSPKTTSRVSLCFASVTDQSSDLAFEARDCGAIFLERSVEKILPRGGAHKPWTYVVMGNPKNDLLEAIALKGQLDAQGSDDKTRIILCTEVTDLEPLVNPQGVDRTGLSVRTVDYSQQLAENILSSYPLFLRTERRSSYGGGSPSLVAATDVADLRVAVVGAGVVGIRFLKSGAWCAQIDGVRVSFDVIDRLATSRAKHLGATSSSIRPEKADSEFEGYCERNFIDMDAMSEDYERYIEEHAEDLGYCLVALGDDQLTAQIAMRTAQLLERAAIRSSASGDALEASDRPLIVAVIRDDKLAAAVESANRGGCGYAIHCIGGRDDVYTFESLWGKERPTEYARRSTRAADLHRKYRLFAFVRASLLGLHGLAADQQLADDVKAIDWCADFGNDFSNVKAMLKDDPSAQGSTALERTIARYLTYLRSTPALAEDGPGNHEWLLRMEHARWNAYMLSEGYEQASIDEVNTFFGTRDVGQLGNGHLHHHDFALLHPCIVDFDQLDELDEPLEQLYLSNERWKEMSASFLAGDTRHRLKLKDDRYL